MRGQMATRGILRINQLEALTDSLFAICEEQLLCFCQHIIKVQLEAEKHNEV